MKKIVIITILLSLLIGCASVISRRNDGVNPAFRSGIYPATRVDTMLFMVGISAGEMWWFVPWSIFELPISITVDTVLIPYDLLRN